MFLTFIALVRSRSNWRRRHMDFGSSTICLIR